MRRFFVLLLFVFFSCDHHIALLPQAADQLGKWFDSPSQRLKDSLLLYNDLSVKTDSLFAVSRMSYQGKTGQCTTVVLDSSHNEYTLGWKTPKTIKRDTLYPLIIYLHGGTGTMVTTKGEFAWDMLSPLGDTFNLFLASPSANRMCPWWSPDGIKRILQTVRFMTLRYPINPDKIFLAGVSDGATGCYAAANTINSPFAGFIAVSGFGGMVFQMGMKLYPQNLMQRPILNINAGQDQIYSILEVRKFVDWLSANGVNVEKTEYPDEKHGFDYRWKEFGHLAQCIRTWSRPHNNNAVSWVFVKGYPNITDNCYGYTLNSDVDEPEIRGYIKSDTLCLTSRGISSVLVSFQKMQLNPLTVKSSAIVQQIKPLPRINDITLNYMCYRLFPEAYTGKIYMVKLDKKR